MMEMDAIYSNAFIVGRYHLVSNSEAHEWVNEYREREPQLRGIVRVHPDCDASYYYPCVLDFCCFMNKYPTTGQALGRAGLHLRAQASDLTSLELSRIMSVGSGQRLVSYEGSRTGQQGRQHLESECL